MLFQFHIQIKGVSKPPVWRRVVVPASRSFLDFHYLIQTAFGWLNCHLFEFSERPFDNRIAIKEPHESDIEIGNEVWDAAKTKLSKIFPAHKTYIYVYDYGDCWEHVIKLEKVIEKNGKEVKLTGGKGMCPPEDCGGIRGYENLKESLKDPGHPEHEEYREWLDMAPDEVYDPSRFDLDVTAEMIQRIK